MTVFWFSNEECITPNLKLLQDDNDWGDTDWGDNSLVSKSNDAEEEKKKQREEKRLQRQKEIEAKRAAKKGPMKLGAKKQAQSDLFWNFFSIYIYNCNEYLWYFKGNNEIELKPK